MSSNKRLMLGMSQLLKKKKEKKSQLINDHIANIKNISTINLSTINFIKFVRANLTICMTSIMKNTSLKLKNFPKFKLPLLKLFFSWIK